GIAFLTTLLFASTGVGFLIMAGAAALAMVAGRWLVEPGRNPSDATPAVVEATAGSGHPGIEVAGLSVEPAMAG
ncbi:MAG: hypothetical protein WBB52_02700, partial [Acidimicrobiales bacterium]